ncbi:UspA domain protein [Natrialba magadii ATCC 43099]|uniref:UspA domain protein n=1 Tax=Natrialba magadii (strain ATCC 43099 / DSM 3394 / CCM 3739 / CIP 104546 / IAM 13178 / JCM 8861 / NBRC 102185 / NCIMB 2190 / MS3) TaxID=547559 RepID=D3SVC8_NATMM|nr:universal stress protein [Natrialba magadii]ADD05536.1 UspA domain protein [Natrialba magadii ATCC 43099]ELY29502.1 UspA domain-containing protein [Natrialba magadii ATCC 43099]
MNEATEPARMTATGPDRVLVPTLGRPGEDEALAYALEMFPDAEVILLAVVMPLDAPLSEGNILKRDETRTEEARRTTTELLESVSADVPSASDRIRIETTEGRPWTVIPRYASDADVDHVVMYGHEKGSGTGTPGFVRRFLGRTIATTVVDRTDRPVTVLE